MKRLISEGIEREKKEERGRLIFLRLCAAWFLANATVAVGFMLLKDGRLTALGGWELVALVVAVAIAAAVGVALATAVDNCALAVDEEPFARHAARLWMFKNTVLMLVAFGLTLVTTVIVYPFLLESPSGGGLEERMWEALCFLTMAWYEVAAAWALMPWLARWLKGGRTAD